MSAPLQEAFGPRGMLAAAIDSYEVRPAQLAMAEAVDAAIHDGRHLMVEAPRGTGHVLAWGVPAMWHAAMEEGPVLVVAGSLAEQERLVTQDLPVLAAAVPWEVTIDRLEAGASYLCQVKLAEVRQAAAEDPEIASAPFLRGLLAWAEHTTTGSMFELEDRPPLEAWFLLAAHRDECPGEACPLHGSCFARQAVERARTAHLVVTRSSILFALLRGAEASGAASLLDRFAVIVLEQAHRLPDAARGGLGWRLGQADLARPAEYLRDADLGWLAEALGREAVAFCRELGEAYRAARGQALVGEPFPVPWRSLQRRLVATAEHLEEAAASAEANGQRETAALRRGGAERVRTLIERLGEGTGAPVPGRAISIEVDGWDRGVLVSHRLELNELLPGLLFESRRSVILCSDTLTAGGSFAMLRHELGVPDPVELVVAPPPVVDPDLPLVLPTELPEPGERGWSLAAALLVREVVRLVPGRVLVLLSSRAQVDLARRGIGNARRTVIHEGQGAPSAPVEGFARHPDAVLLVTPAFLDAALDEAPVLDGVAIDALVLDRLPFAGSEDAVNEAVRARDPRWFGHLCLPRAVIALRRIVGLLGPPGRRHGALVLLDRRLVDRPYGRFFLRSLPPVRLVRRLEQLPHLLGAASAPTSQPGAQP